MPDGHDPHEPSFDPIEEPMRRHDHFPVWELGEFLDQAVRFGEFRRPPERRFSFFPKSASGVRIVLADVQQCGEELPTD